MGFIYPVDKKFSNHSNNYAGDRSVDGLDIHYGLDFSGKGVFDNEKIRNKNIYAVDDSKIIFSNFNPSGYGNAIIIKHSNGLSTLYAHMVEESPYKYGDYVKQGTVIGKVGNTGKVKASPGGDGTHLYFEVIDQEGTKKIEAVDRSLTGEYRYSIGIFKKEHKLDPRLYLPISKDNPKSFARERKSEYFKWKCEGKNSCSKCKERDGKIYKYGVDREPPLHYNCDCTVEDYIPQTKSELFDLEFKDYKRCFNRDMNMFKECINELREELRGLKRKCEG